MFTVNLTTWTKGTPLEKANCQVLEFQKSDHVYERGGVHLGFTANVRNQPINIRIRFYGANLCLGKGSIVALPLVEPILFKVPVRWKHCEVTIIRRPQEKDIIAVSHEKPATPLSVLREVEDMANPVTIRYHQILTG